MHSSNCDQADAGLDVEPRKLAQEVDKDDSDYEVEHDTDFGHSSSEVDDDGQEKLSSSLTTLGQKRFHCTYDGCAKMFSKRVRLEAHIAVRHTGYLPYKCPEPGCPSSFACQTYLNKHLRRHCKANPPKQRPSRAKLHPCPHCTSAFRGKAQLKCHEAKHHGAPLPFTCEHCSQRFLYRSKLRGHLRRHRGYRCDQCSFEVDALSRLRGHKAKEHPRSLACAQCGKHYRTAYNLRIHEETIHFAGDAEANPWLQRPNYSCEHCSKCYTRESSLRTHVKVSHEGRKFKCHLCPLEYRYSKSLVQHCYRAHGAEAKQQCSSRLSAETSQPCPRKASKKVKGKSTSRLNRITRIKDIIELDDEDQGELLAEQVAEEDGSIVRGKRSKTDHICLEDLEKSNLLMDFA